MTCPWRLIQQRLEFHRYLVVNGTSRAERVFGERKSIPLPQRVFSFDSQRVTHDAHSQPSREPERSCLGGRSLCMGGAASQRCEGVASKRPLAGMLRLCDIWNVQRVQFFLAAAAGAAIPFLFTNKASAAESKRILTVHSFSGAAPPVAVHSFE